LLASYAAIGTARHKLSQNRIPCITYKNEEFRASLMDNGQLEVRS